MTPACYHRLLDERQRLVKVERPEVVQVVSWAASNGDRSENGDYLYGKKRLREIDRRIRFLNKRLENSEVVDPATRPPTDQVFLAPRCCSAMKTVMNQELESLELTRPMRLWEMCLGFLRLLEFS